MNMSILDIVESVSNLKRIEKEKIFTAIESALATVTKRRLNPDMEVRVAVDRETGEYSFFRQWFVIDLDTLEDPLNKEVHLTVVQAQPRKADAKDGDIIEEPIDPIEFGRISAQIGRQVISQIMRIAERDQVAEEYADNVGKIITGTVKKTTRDNIIIDLTNNAEAILPRSELIPREIFRPGDRVRAVLQEIREDTKGPSLMASRIDPKLLIELFRVEVPEVTEELISIDGAARDPGSRAKIAVSTNDGRIDPIGACVGMRGSRVQAVSTELGGERVDIVLWDANPAQFAINVMAPAEVASIMVDEETNTMDIAVREEQLALAIGRNGQNVRLASDLTGWKINVMSEEDAAEKTENESGKTIAHFMENLNIEEDVAQILVQEDFTTLEEVAYVPMQEMLEIEEFDEDIVNELRQRARDALLVKAMSGDSDAPEKDLLEMEGMTDELANKLASNGVKSMDDLAELATSDLIEIESNLTEEKAGELIMTARAPWFSDSE